VANLSWLSTRASEARARPIVQTHETGSISLAGSYALSFEHQLLNVASFITRCRRFRGPSAWVDDNKELWQNFPAIRGSNISEISFWGKHTLNGATDVFVEVLFSDGSSFNNNSTFRTTNGVWSKIDATAYVNRSKFVTGVSVFGNTNSPFFLDDFVVRVVPEPSALVSFMTGRTVLVASHPRWRWPG
jgi:hypothetical protein